MAPLLIRTISILKLTKLLIIIFCSNSITINSFVPFLPTTTITSFPSSTNNILLTSPLSLINTMKHGDDPSSKLTLQSKSSTIVDVDYEYDDEDESNILSSNNRTTFNIIKLPSSSNNEKIVEIVSFDLPTSYIIPIHDDDNDNDGHKKYAMIDVPPYSKELYNNIQSFISNNGKCKSSLDAILITNQNSIYYNNNELTDEDNYYTRRESDLSNWKSLYPEINVVMHRIDVPRDSKAYVTQELDGYGPFAYDTQTDTDDTFIETGKPLTVIKWDDDKVKSFAEEDVSDEELQSIEENRKMLETNTSIIACYTPGHTSGSVCYIFTKLKLCCSGFTIPIENNDVTQDQDTGIRLDYKGYVTTNKGGIKRQIDSVNEMMNKYCKNYIDVILPSRGGVYYLPTGSSDDDFLYERKMNELKDMMEKFVKVGDIYESLGI